jgi:enoyl-CoA hydratase/carnithine racemase
VNENAGDAPVLCEVEDGIATVILNRPQRMNAWTYAMEVATST